MSVPAQIEQHRERVLEAKVPCPLLALSGHGLVHRTCPLLGVKRICGNV